MKILIFAKPGARRIGVQKMPIQIPGFDACLSVAVRERAHDGAANRAIVVALAEHFGVAPDAVRIIAGQTSRRKVFRVG